MTLIPQTYDFSELLGKGENPRGMVSHTPNGTETNGRGSDGVTPVWSTPNGPRWNENPMPETEPVDVDVAPIPVRAHTRRRK